MPLEESTVDKKAFDSKTLQEMAIFDKTLDAIRRNDSEELNNICATASDRTLQVLVSQHYVNSLPLLHIACENGNVHAAGKLLDCGANPLATDKWGMSALHISIQAKSFESMVFLCETPGRSLRQHIKALRRSQDFEGRTPLHLAASLDPEGEIFVSHLLKDIPNVDDKSHELLDIKDHIGSSALHYAAEAGSVTNMILLLNAIRNRPDNSGTLEASLNLQNSIGNTSLHRAARHGHKDAVNLLIEAGANASLANNEGSTPSDLARSANHIDVSKLLLEAETTILLLQTD